MRIGDDEVIIQHNLMPSHTQKYIKGLMLYDPNWLPWQSYSWKTWDRVLMDVVFLDKGDIRGTIRNYTSTKDA